MKPDVCKYKFYLACGAESYEEEVTCSPSQVRSQLIDRVESPITYSFKKVDD